MQKHTLAFLGIVAAARLASAQLVSFGAIGGVPFIQQISNHDESRPYIVGPSVEFRLPAGFAVEADALYRRIGQTGFFGFIEIGAAMTPTTLAQSDRLRGNEWQFPLVGKYYFRRNSSWQPFLGTGYSFRTVGTHHSISQTFIDANGATQHESFRLNSRSDLGVGAVVAAGIRLHAGRLAILPEIRYTRWGSQNNIFFHKNEAAGLLGISF